MIAQAALPTSTPENTLTRFLYWLATACTILVIVVLFLPYLLRDSAFFTGIPFFYTNATAGIGLIGLCAWYAAGDVRRFRALVTITGLGFLTGAAAMLALYFSPAGSAWQTPLLVGFAIYALLAVITGWFAWRAMPQRPSWSPWIPEKPMTGWEKAGRIVYGAFGIISIVAVLGSILGAFDPVNPLAALWQQPVFVAGSAVKIGILGYISLFVALKIRHRLNLMTVVILGHAVSWVVITVLALFGYGRFGDYTLTLGGMTVDSAGMMFGAWLLDVVIITAFGLIQRAINKAVVDNVRFFSPLQFRILEAVMETLIEGADFERLPPYQAVLNTDVYLGSFRSSRLWLAQLTLLATEYFPLMWRFPPMTFLSPVQRREFVNKRFKEEIITLSPGYRFMNGVLLFINRVLHFLRGRSSQAELDAALTFTDLLEGLMRFDMQMCYLGYYGDDRTWNKDEKGIGLGYVPFTKRPRSFLAVPERKHPPLEVMTPEHVARRGMDVIDDADIVIIGSGAGGAILAEQMLLKNPNRKVLMLERGLYSHPDTFTEDEIDMVSRLYSDGALQISQSLRFTILQGSAVGGTTVVNNAVCFDTPDEVLTRWNRGVKDSVINEKQFCDAQQKVRERMSIGRINTKTRTPLDDALNHGDRKLNDGVKRYFDKHPELGVYDYDVVEANITDCLGCGYCNIGCKYGRKISMLDEVLPGAQKVATPERFQILSEAEAVHLKEENKKITEITVMIGGKRKLLIKNPNTVVVSAGTIASSWLLKRSGIGANLPVGRGLSFNMGSPLYGWFGEAVNAYDGLQIAHYLKIKDRPGFVYETWYNPPLAQALTMPGWLDTHFQNMQRYNEMAAIGVLVGTESNASVEPALLVRGPDVVYKPTQKDMNSLLDALKILGGILFESGAKEVFASTRKYQAYVQGEARLKNPADINKLEELIKDDTELLLGTGHPQGGNAIGSSPEHAVIDGNFKVFGYDNLYICDASVHPTSTTVNPQLTVMTLAHYASDRIK